jgi:hypothetical protein
LKFQHAFHAGISDDQCARAEQNDPELPASGGTMKFLRNESSRTFIPPRRRFPVPFYSAGQNIFWVAVFSPVCDILNSTHRKEPSVMKYHRAYFGRCPLKNTWKSAPPAFGACPRFIRHDVWQSFCDCSGEFP